VTRRVFLAAPVATLLQNFGTPERGALQVARRGALQTDERVRGGRLLGTVPLGLRQERMPPLDTLLGTGLDARLFTDLSTLSPETLITSNERFFIRTTQPDAARTRGPWTIRLEGRTAASHTVALDELKTLERPMGTHLLECSGNTGGASYGLMSAAQWTGVPIAALLDRVGRVERTERVLIAGLDDLDRESRTSVPGASWIFTRGDLDDARAFLATRMNGIPLSPDHGFPVRLVVPGWYGCACIKWLDRIAVVPDDEPSTPHMREFARRTHQTGTPTLAREFTAATMDHAAFPVRVEKWRVGDRLRYRLVGILWGGSRPTNALQIQFRHDQPFAPVEDCPLPASTTTWSLWTHWWRPETPGRYEVLLRVSDPTLRARRLDRFYYAREVVVDEV
jgi:DMSO/TMAO reductase YedYZ molybdopterin-dependent catalytic subunit